MLFRRKGQKTKTNTQPKGARLVLRWMYVLCYPERSCLESRGCESESCFYSYAARAFFPRVWREYQRMQSTATVRMNLLELSPTTTPTFSTAVAVCRVHVHENEHQLLV